jgi:hypothetical protein
MAIGDQIECAKIDIPENVKMVTDPETVVVSIIKPGEKIEESDGKAVKAGKK